MILSYSPTTNEAQAMEKLNVSAEVIKKLKKQNILKYAGHLICNRSIEEYIKGGKGYHDSLQIALQMKIDESVKKQYAEQTFFKNVGVQLAFLLKHNYVKISYVDDKVYSPKNLFMIKSIQWTNKIESSLEFKLNAFHQNYITPVATTMNTDNYQNDISQFLNLIKKIGAVDKFFKHLDIFIEKRLKQLEKVSETFTMLDTVDKKIVESIIENKSKRISNDNMLPYMKYSNAIKKENKNLDLELSKIEKNNKEKFSDYLVIIRNLEIKYEIGLLNTLKNKLENKKSFGYDNIVDDFQAKRFVMNNQLISLSDITKIVNHTRSLYNKAPLVTGEKIISELQSTIAWNFNSQ